MTNFTQQILANPEGGTVSLTASELPTTGYYVGGKVVPLVIDDSADVEDDIDFFVEYLHTLGAEYLGWWTDEETGKLWVDASDWFAEYEQAETVCRARGEIAFYSIADERSFRPVILP